MNAWRGGLGIVLMLAVIASVGAVAKPTHAVAQDAGPLARARRLHAEAVRAQRQGQPQQGIAPAREALALREAALGPNHVAVAESLQTLGDLLRETEDYTAARPILERALAIREQALGRDDALVGQTLTTLGMTLYRLGDYQAARPVFERALVIRERFPGPNEVALATTLSDFGILLAATGEYAEAGRMLERALAIRERAFGPTSRVVAQSLQNLGELRRDTGDYAGAKALLERALAIREKEYGPDHRSVADALDGLGTVAFRTGDPAAARPLLERALTIREQALGPNHRLVASTLGNLGSVLQALGEYGRARTVLERSVAIREQALGPQHPIVALGLQQLAELLIATGDYAAARPLVERAQAIREKTLGPDHRSVAGTLQLLGQIEQASGNNAEAKRLYERALAIREKTLGPTNPLVASTMVRLSQIERITGDQQGALRLAERALAIREQSYGPNHPVVAMSLTTLASQYRLAGDRARAKPLYERALVIARATNNAEQRWRAAYGLGLVYERENQRQQALAYYREAAQMLDDLVSQVGDEGRAQYLQSDNRSNVYDALARVLLRLHQRDASKGYDREAWAVIESKKGRLAAEALMAARPRPKDPKARKAVEDVQAKQEQLLALDRELREEQAKTTAEQQPDKVRNLTTLMAQTKTEYLAQVQSFLVQYPRYKSLFVDQQTVDPKALAKFAGRLPAGTVVVQYFASPDALYIFVVAADGLFNVKSQAVTQADLYPLVTQYRELLARAERRHLPWADDGSDAYRQDVLPLRQVTQKLSEHLLVPIGAELDKYKDLVVIPNDLLLYLPIHALTRKLPDGSTRFLTETHAVSYLTQLELADLLNPSRPSPDAPLLALANPDGSLPAASREVRAIRGARSAVTTLEGDQATKERLLNLASQFSHLHLATHGVLDPVHPESSYLLMAGAEPASQRLGVGEIAGLSLHNGLAVLSACDTAVGEQVPGAALVTLAAAFSQAGAESVVASLWRVNDAATRDLMVAFHRALATTGRAAALQKAEISVLSKPETAHPYYWAPFVLIGAR